MHQQALKFYSNTIDDFIELVEKQYKGKGVISNEQIDKMKKLLKHKINDPSKYHKQIISNFFAHSFSLTNNQTQQKLEEKSRSEHQDSESNPIKNYQLQKQQKPEKQQKPAQKLYEQQLSIKPQSSNMRSFDEEEDDDLNQFKKNSQGKSALPKFQQISQQYQNQPDSNHSYEFLSNDDDQKLNFQELSQIKQKTGMHILGSYNTREKKFNSKKEQTKLTLYNTFVKIHGHDQELLFPVVQILATRVSKGQVNI